MVSPTTLDNLITKINTEFGIASPTYESELRYLYYLATSRIKHGRTPVVNMVELGTETGYSTLVLAQAIVDWPRQPSHLTTVDKQSSKKRQLVQSRIEDCGFQKVVSVVGSDDAEYMGSLEAESVDFYFLDTWHVRHHVLKNLDVAIEKIAPCGLISGHDYCYEQYDVIRAVEEWRVKNAEKVFGWLVQERIWWFIKNVPPKRT